MTPTNDIAVKIKKLLELANKGNTTEAEANLAMERVQQLLARYNLDMSQVEAVSLDRNVTDSEHPEDVATAKRADEKHTRGAMYEYQRRLWSTIASVNFCWYFDVPVYKTVENKHGEQQFRKVNSQHRMVGREVNVIAAKLMGDYLEQTINRLCPWQGRECLSRSAISWKEGCASRLQSRLWERYEKLQEESVAAAADSKALTLANVKDSEWEANYAFLYGQDALKQYVERRAAREQKQREAAAQTIVNAPAEKPETNAQRKKREAREAREAERAQRRSEKYWERRDLNAWYQGRETADNINLDSQVDKSKGERSLE